MIKLIAIGLLSGLFFSTTFILNRLMSLEGGHWVWSASLRYAYMILLLLGAVPLFQGRGAVRNILALFGRHWFFWTISGSIGFGGFYSLLLQAPMPTAMAVAGVVLVFAGLALFIYYQEVKH